MRVLSSYEEKKLSQGDGKLNSSITEKLRPKALEYLENTRIGVGVGSVAKQLGVSWSTARQTLMELVLEGKIECENTTTSKIFRIKKSKTES